MENILYSDGSITKPVLRRVGITRLTNITSLDTLGIPVWTAFRADVADPETGNLSVYNGKALTGHEARLGAILEAAERYCAEKRHFLPEIRTATESELAKRGEPIVSPSRLFRLPGVRYRKSMRLEWVKARKIPGRNAFWLPAYAILCPYVPSDGLFAPGLYSSVGLASGFSHDAAVASALLELIEHDAALHAERKNFGVTVDFTGVRIRGLKTMLHRFHKAGLSLTVKDVSGRTGLYTFIAACDDPHTRNPLLLACGQAAHFDPFVAMGKAILEAAQSRLTMIQGAREDLEKERFKVRLSYDRVKHELAHWYEPGRKVRNISTYAKPPVTNPKAALRLIFKGLRKAGLKEAYATDLTRPEIGVTVVRAVVPGLRHWDD